MSLMPCRVWAGGTWGACCAMVKLSKWHVSESSMLKFELGMGWRDMGACCAMVKLSKWHVSES